MSEREFRIVVRGRVDDYDRLEEALVGAGIDDGYLGATDAVVFVDFSRAGGSMTDAILSAIRDLRAAGVHAERVAADDLVTAAEIARRTGRTRESVRLLVEGERGPGGFPAPVSQRLRSRHWRWVEVAEWLERHGLAEPGHTQDAKAIAAINGALELVRNTTSDQSRHAIVRALDPSPA